MFLILLPVVSGAMLIISAISFLFGNSPVMWQIISIYLLTAMLLFEDAFEAYQEEKGRNRDG
ncbi:hypothetical protein [Oceanobacillus jeddahense]|uniref:hypothetical protein n=1 Tax=Oceanobacillus jeddahense TaxID=1462527 RepID=UPI000595C3E5|nr:hypothetical protein [Oceanobacillus jeddahense]